MCILCVEIAKNKMTCREIARAFIEISVVNEKHAEEILVELEKNGNLAEVQEELVNMALGEFEQDVADAYEVDSDDPFDPWFI